LDENIESPGNENHIVPKWESNKNNLNEITKGKPKFYFFKSFVENIILQNINNYNYKESKEKDDNNINDIDKLNPSATRSDKPELSNNNNINKISLKPNSTKNRCGSIINHNNFNLFPINSIPEEINSNDNLSRFENENFLKKKADCETNSNRNSIHIEKNVSYFINKKNEDILKEKIKSPFNPYPINPLEE